MSTTFLTQININSLLRWVDKTQELMKGGGVMLLTTRTHECSLPRCVVDLVDSALQSIKCPWESIISEHVTATLDIHARFWYNSSCSPFFVIYTVIRNNDTAPEGFQPLLSGFVPFVI